MKRRDFLKLAGASAGASSLAGVAGCASTPSSKGRVVVIGGGFGGATAAKYLRLWDPAIEVVLVERELGFTSCPISNLVLAGYSSMQEISRGYAGVRRHGVQVLHDEALAVDPVKKTVRLARGGEQMLFERYIRWEIFWPYQMLKNISGIETKYLRLNAHLKYILIGSAIIMRSNITNML